MVGRKVQKRLGSIFQRILKYPLSLSLKLGSSHPNLSEVIFQTILQSD